MLVFSNPTSEIAKRLAASKKDYSELAELLDGLLVGTLPGDFYDLNDGFPVLSKKSSRRRIYMTKSWEILRFEAS